MSAIVATGIAIIILITLPALFLYMGKTQQDEEEKNAELVHQFHDSGLVDFYYRKRQLFLKTIVLLPLTLPAFLLPDLLTKPNAKFDLLFIIGLIGVLLVYRPIRMLISKGPAVTLTREHILHDGIVVLWAEILKIRVIATRSSSLLIYINGHEKKSICISLSDIFYNSAMTKCIFEKANELGIPH